MKANDWEKRNEDYIAEASGDDDLSDEQFIEVLVDLIDRAQSSVDAKREELEDDESA